MPFVYDTPKEQKRANADVEVARALGDWQQALYHLELVCKQIPEELQAHVFDLRQHPEDLPFILLGLEALITRWQLQSEKCRELYQRYCDTKQEAIHHGH